MTNFRGILDRLYRSTVVWSWLFNGLQLASGLVLLPLLALQLSKPDLGMYIVFLNLGALVAVVDFGFAVSIERNVSYAMGGAKELKAEGILPSETHDPNYPLLWQLLRTTQSLYRYLSLAAILLMGIFGTFMVGLRVQETDHPTITWWAWGIALVASVWEIYAGWWNVFLRGTNNILLAARLSVLSYGLRLLIAAGLLIAGGGLLSLPVATLFGNLLQRYLSRRACLRLLRDKPIDRENLPAANLLAVLWPGSWRVGLQYVSGYLSSNASIFICTALFGLDATAKYGLSVRIISIIQGMSVVWISVKWPLIGQLRARNDFENLRKIFRPRLWLHLLTFAFLAALAVPLSPVLLKWIGSDKELLPGVWLAMLAVNAFFETHYSVWGTLIFMGNRMPYLWAAVITNAAGLALSLVLINHTELGLASLVIAPLVAGILFNYWRWPMEGAKSLQTTWFRFMFFPVKI
ncbi:MAG: hypothetical protein ABIR24_11475 [Verrucomicrobiota bacterium]